MYQYPVLLPPFSNREDFVFTASIWDDDANEAINLAGIVKAFAGTFTAASWIVTCGTVVTTSATSLTIPDYPINDQLLALSLTVGTGLSIAVGSSVQITDAVTGGNSFYGYVTSYTSATGALVCQVGLSFQFEIRCQGPAGGVPGISYSSSDFGSVYDYGGGVWALPGYGAPVISASLSDYISIVDLGFYTINIPEAITRRLNSKTYLASLTVRDGAGAQRQVFIGKLPEVWGGVTV